MQQLFPELSTREIVSNIFACLLHRRPTEADLDAIQARLKAGEFTLEDLSIRITLGAEFLQQFFARPQRHHLHVLHAARLKLIRGFLPGGRRILDVGGANGSMLDYGYQQKFEELILTDIPADQRIPELRDIDLMRKWAGRGNVRVLYTSLTDLSALSDGSVDLVWVGQVVEHITEEELKIALREIFRVLQPGGHFCFDTPNGILTRIHSPDQLIHPEHKKEYTPAELRTVIGEAGFQIEEELGMVSMPRTYRTRVFSYEEMVLNSGFSRDLDSCYLVYFSCMKPPAGSTT